jgi:hypothetical protein
VLLVGLVGSAAAAPGAHATGVAGYGMSALAVGVRYQLNSPGFLPVGDPAEGNIMEVDVPISRTGVSQGPLMNAIASPLYPGDTAAHLGTAVATFSPQAPHIDNYPVVAEANYPPTPDKGANAAFGSGGIGEGTAELTAAHAKVVARTIEQSVEGVIGIGASVTRNDITIADDKVRSTASSATGPINIADLITIDGVIGTAEANSDGSKATPAGHLEIGKVTVAGQAAYIDGEGVHVATTPGVGAGVVAGLQQLVNATLATDGIKVRTLLPQATIDGASGTATSGALAISLERTIPALGVPGVPALELPTGQVVALGTPDLPTHIDILIGEARATAAATSLSLDVDLAPAPDLIDNTQISGNDFTSVTGPGASFVGAITNPPLSQAGAADLGLIPAENVRGKGIPIGWVIVGIFGAFVFSGPLLGYARWQLLEGRHR